MKKTLTTLLTAALLASATLAHATPTLKDVEQAVKRDHDYRLAERLMKDVVDAHPDNANDHYVYAQLLEHNGKYSAAGDELEAAKRIDPSLGFVRNRADFNKLAAAVGRNNSTAAPAAAPAAPSNNSVSAAPDRPAAPYVAPAPQKKSNGLLWAFVILAGLGVVVYFLYRKMQKTDQAEDEARAKMIRQEQLKKATELLESIKPLKLDVRMANPANPALLSEIEDVERNAIKLIDRLATMPVSQSEIAGLENDIARLRRKFEGKPEPVPASSGAYGNGSNGGNNGFTQVPNTQYPGQNQVPPQQTVVVQQGGGNDGFLTGMMIGSMLGGGHHDREIIHETRIVHDDDDYRRRNDRDDDIDFGNDSGDSGGGGDIDFGGGDDS